MVVKLNPHSSYGRKLISLFSKLLFTRRKYSLIELSESLDCSKQSIIRLIEDIRMSYGVDIDESIEKRRKYYQIKQTHYGDKPIIALTHDELNLLQMCKSFSEHLLGKELLQEASSAIEKSHAFTSGTGPSKSSFGHFHGGMIDYTPHKRTLQTLITSIEDEKICEVAYRPISIDVIKSYMLEPLKIFSHQDSIYLHARKSSGKQQNTENSFVFAVHRIKTVKITDRNFSYPLDYNFEKTFNEHFGVIKGDAFWITIEFKGFAADYVAERVWNSEKRKEWIDDDTLLLTFKSSSEPELIGWVLSWGGRARVIEPTIIKNKVRKAIEALSLNQ